MPSRVSLQRFVAKAPPSLPRVPRGSVPLAQRYYEVLRRPAPITPRSLPCHDVTSVPFRVRSGHGGTAPCRPGVGQPGSPSRLGIRGGDRTSQVPGGPAVPRPCSGTPAGPDTPGHTARRQGPRCGRRRGLPRLRLLSGLNPRAWALAVYASPSRLPAPTQDSLPAAWPSLAGWGWLPTGSQ